MEDAQEDQEGQEEDGAAKEGDDAAKEGDDGGEKKKKYKKPEIPGEIKI